MPLQRTRHWATREFHAFLRTRVRTPHVWGQHDCALFAADAIKSYTGVDIAADFRNPDGTAKYSTKAEAFALIQTVTGAGKDPATAVGDAAAWCAEKHGMVEWEHPLFARRGDLVVMEQDGALIAGVVHLSGHMVAVGEVGLRKVPITEVKRSWHV